MTKLRRFLVFAYDEFYPGGGWSDFVGSFGDYESAQKRAQEVGRKFFDVIDIETGEEVHANVLLGEVP